MRVVAATHRDLEAMGREGTFRSDLYYRLHGMTIAVPPLRERKDEIAPLAEAFLRDAARDNARAVRAFDAPAMAALVRWTWPGNVRELKNVVERGVVIARGDVITMDDLPERVRDTNITKDGVIQGPAPSYVAPMGSSPPGAGASAPPPSLMPAFTPAPMAAVDPNVDYKKRLRLEMQRYERELIVNALAAAGGNVTAAAAALKIPVRTLTHKMQALQIKKKFESE